MSAGTDFAPASGAQDQQRVLLAVFLLAIVVVGVGTAIAPFYMPVVVLGGMAFAFCASEKRLKYAIFALAAYTPFEEFLLKWIPDQLFFYARFAHYGFIAACLAVILIRRFVEGRPLWIRTPLDIPLALFLLISVISMVRNDSPLGAMVFSYQPMLRFIILAFYAVQFIDFTEKDAKRLLILLAGIVMVEGLIGLAQSVIGLPASEFLAPTARAFMGFEAGGTTQFIQPGYFNIFGTMNRYNTLGAFMGMMIVLITPFYSRKLKSGWVFWLFYGIAGLCLVLANARAPWLGTIAGVWFIFAMKGQAKAFVMPLAGLLLLFSTLVVFSDQIAYYGWDEASGLQRFLEPFSGEYRQKMSDQFGRIYYMTGFPIDILRYDVETFLIGFGPGTLGTRAQDIYGLYALTPLGIMREWQFYVADVNWAYILGQAGFLGLGAFVWGLFGLFRESIKLYRRAGRSFLRKLSLGYAALFVFAMTIACFFPMFEIRPLSLYFWLLGGIVLKLSHANEQSPLHERA